MAFDSMSKAAEIISYLAVTSREFEQGFWQRLDHKIVPTEVGIDTA